jgi:beta-1,4-N-acetylglucosaminyltransferase
MKIGMISSAGGHLTEILEIAPAFEGHQLFMVTYNGPRVAELAQGYPTYALDNIGTSPWRAFAALPLAWRVMRHERPEVLISTGSEIALPFFLVAKLLGIRTVYVECTCRVYSSSATGRLLYRLVDAFYVQWPQLAPVYGPRARFEGGLLL